MKDKSAGLCSLHTILLVFLFFLESGTDLCAVQNKSPGDFFPCGCKNKFSNIYILL